MSVQVKRNMKGFDRKNDYKTGLSSQKVIQTWKNLLFSVEKVTRPRQPSQNNIDFPTKKTFETRNYLLKSFNKNAFVSTFSESS